MEGRINGCGKPDFTSAEYACVQINENLLYRAVRQEMAAGRKCLASPSSWWAVGQAAALINVLSAMHQWFKCSLLQHPLERACARRNAAFICNPWSALKLLYSRQTERGILPHLL